MRKLFLAFNALFGGVVLTLILAAGALLLLMASTPEAGVRKEGLFGGVFFSTETSASGSIGISLGINSWTSITVVWIVSSLFIFATILVAMRLRRYRASLVAQPSSL